MRKEPNAQWLCKRCRRRLQLWDHRRAFGCRGIEMRKPVQLQRHALTLLRGSVLLRFLAPPGLAAVLFCSRKHEELRASHAAAIQQCGYHEDGQERIANGSQHSSSIMTLLRSKGDAVADARNVSTHKDERKHMPFVRIGEHRMNMHSIKDNERCELTARLPSALSLPSNSQRRNKERGEIRSATEREEV